MSPIKPKRMPGGGICYDDGKHATERDAAMAKYTDHEPLPEDATPDVLDEMEMAGFMCTMMDDGGIGD